MMNRLWRRLLWWRREPSLALNALPRIIRPRERRRIARFYLNEALPAFLIGAAAVAGPAILLLLNVPG